MSPTNLSELLAQTVIDAQKQWSINLQTACKHLAIKMLELERNTLIVAGARPFVKTGAAMVDDIDLALSKSGLNLSNFSGTDQNAAVTIFRRVVEKGRGWGDKEWSNWVSEIFR